MEWCRALTNDRGKRFMTATPRAVLRVPLVVPTATPTATLTIFLLFFLLFSLKENEYNVVVTVSRMPDLWALQLKLIETVISFTCRAASNNEMSISGEFKHHLFREESYSRARWASKNYR